MKSSISPTAPRPSFLASLWQFSRPHTIIGTSLSVWALALLAVTPETFSWGYGQSVLGAWLACLAGNVFIVGLNQLTDIDIDKINKPHLPVAAGHFSRKTGWGIVWFCGALALILSAFSGLWLGVTVWGSLAIGTMYSLPPVRLKRFPLLAAMCIFTVRGVVVNLGLFAHFQTMLQNPVVITPTVWLLTGFIIVFTVAIAIFKDVPDLEGDRQYQITTFTILLGKKRIFQLSLGIIFACYAGMIVGEITMTTSLNQLLFIGCHIILGALLWWRSRQIDLESKKSIASFYQFIWKLFFLEYLLFPLAHWL
ncbi:homogentisate phytyltransferase [Picosynechococcus sp. NKBG042902]|uniref:homogentisate phytyltransferase n=1 Tax=Picosynechococcus sp. NKBG042902 TaxID=490193 RepID=UPI0005ED63C4|nr:homogentisate phytyltransferase [Picosynechococcus sp. NKBG042902]